MFFTQFDQQPADPIFGLSEAFRKETNPDKVNLGIGIYQNEEGETPVLTSVRKAEQEVVSHKRTKTYLPISGDPSYTEETQTLIFGEECPKERLYTVQTIGGTGGLRLGGELLKKGGVSTLYVSTPTWPNHLTVFSEAGLQVLPYPYYNSESHGLNFSAFCQALTKLPENSALLLHGCCHNPTGVDPSLEQWQQLSEIIQKKKLIPFFDLAYQGFAATLATDADPIRFFLSEGHAMLVAQSYSKNMGLYGERIGSLSLVTPDRQAKERSESHLKQLIRRNYSNPQRHSARIVKTILKSTPLRKLWLEELGSMRTHIQEVRRLFTKQLMENLPHRSFSFMEKQRGMFSFVGLSENHVAKLREIYGIYMPKSGRINVAGLNSKNLPYVVDAFTTVLHP